MAMAIVVIKRGGGGLFACRDVPRPIGGVDEQQVRFVVIVEVKERHAATHWFGQKLLPISAVVVDERDARFLGNVSELCDRDVCLRPSGSQRGGNSCDLRKWLRGLAFQPEDRSSEHDQNRKQDGQRPADRLADDRVVGSDQLVVFFGWSFWIHLVQGER